ncbi:MAG: outer membrane beta-barrel protein [Bacteroidales bacterium]
MKRVLIIILLCFPAVLRAQQPDVFNLTVKAGASFGGSQPGRFRDDKSANLMLDVTGGIGVSVFFIQYWQICLDLNYIRKGINCPLAFNPEITSFYDAGEDDIEVYGWFDNAYLEIPLTIGYTWGYNICRTRLGVYYARRVATKSRLIIDGNLLEKDNNNADIYNRYEQHLSDHDYGIKIANEFFFNDFSIGLELSTGFIPSIRSSWRVSDSQSYTMAICFYAGYRF